jgi:hypothetical protein
MNQDKVMRGFGYVTLSILLTGVGGAWAQIKPVKLADHTAADSPDPNVVINLRDLKNIVVASAPGKIFYSADAGVSWAETKINSTRGVKGGMKLISGAKGDIALAHDCEPTSTTSNPGFVLQSSGDKGKTWKEEGFFGYYVTKDEKESKDETELSLAVHPGKKELFAAWTQSDKIGLKDVNCHSNILLSSWNGGKWDKPIQLNQTPGDCSGNEQSAGGASVVMDLNDRLFAIWANQGTVYFDRSYDGNVWLSRDLAIARPEKMTLNIPGFNLITSRPMLMIDDTQSKSHGTLYAVYSEGKKESLDTDIALMRSTNRGDHWVGPTRFRKDELMGQQFAPSVAIDQTTGHVYISYYDRRDYEDMKTDIIVAYSLDGGNNFREMTISESSFISSPTNTINPHTSISAHAGKIAMSWTRIDGLKASVWVAVFDETELKSK